MWPLTRNKHQRWTEDLSAYLDDQLSPSVKEALEAHLVSCVSCRDDLESLRNVTMLLHRVPQVPVPRSYTLSEAPAKGLTWSVRYAAPLRYSTAVASLLLLAVVVGDLFTGQESLPNRALLTSPASQDEAQAPFDTSAEGGPSEAGPVAALAPTSPPAPESGSMAIPAVTPTPAPEMFLSSDNLEKTQAIEEMEATRREMGTEGASALETFIDLAKLALAAVIAVMAVLVVAVTWLNRRADTSQ